MSLISQFVPAANGSTSSQGLSGRATWDLRGLGLQDPDPERPAEDDQSGSR